MTPLELVAAGFAVCPVATPREDGSCSCRLGDECPSPGKHPVGRGWKDEAIRQRSNPRAVSMRLRNAPAISYGLIPVPGSGMLVIDRDDPTVLLPVPETFEVHRASADPRRGHYYLRLADGISEDEVPRVFAGGEVRVAGSGHVVGPYCRHVSGDTYEPNGEPIATCDRELVDALAALPPLRTEGNPWDGGTVTEGERHAWLVGQARRLRGNGLDAEVIVDRLRELNDEYCFPPLSERVAEFDRMAEWAERNIAPDAPITVIRGPRTASGRRRRADREWKP